MYISEEEFKYDFFFMSRSIMAEVKLQDSRSYKITFVEAEANVQGISAKAMAALGNNVPLTLLDSEGNKIQDSVSSKGKLYDQTLDYINSY